MRGVSGIGKAVIGKSGAEQAAAAATKSGGGIVGKLVWPASLVLMLGGVVYAMKDKPLFGDSFSP